MNTMTSYSLSTSLQKERIRFLKKGGLFFSVLIGSASIFLLINLHSPNPLIGGTVKQGDLNQSPLIKAQEGDENDDEDEKINYKSCNLFVGRWISDPKGPSYTNASCATIPESKNCGKYGRQDTDYMHWRWKPDECELQRFNAKRFLRMVRGKTLGFIGDSVARNQMESLLCLLSQVETPSNLYKDVEDRFRTWYFPNHDFVLKIIWNKFLVVGTERIINGTNSGVFQLHVDKVDPEWVKELPKIDYAVISDGHWFFRKTYLVERNKPIGCVFCDDANLTKYSIGYAFKRVFQTALKYVSDCKECGNLITLVRTFSPAHFEAGTWNDGGRCNRTMPLNEGDVNLGGTEWEIRNIQVEAVERVKKEGSKRKAFGYLDVTKAMLMRPDGHPGPHWDNNYMQGYNDCVHWCLPGPIDAWNDLLLAVFMKYTY